MHVTVQDRRCLLLVGLFAGVLAACAVEPAQAPGRDKQVALPDHFRWSDATAALDVSVGDDDARDTSAVGDTFPGDSAATDSAHEADACPAPVQFLELTPTVFVLLDHTNSMHSGTLDSTTTRWNIVRTGLFDTSSGLVTRTQDRVRYGLSLFRGGTGSCPFAATVSPGLSQRDALDALMDATDSGGEQPSADAMTQTLPLALSEATSGPVSLVLVTDGEPDTCADPTNETGRPEILRVATDAYAAGIESFFLAFGGAPADAFLQQAANAGQGQPVDTGTARFYRPTTDAEAAAQFAELFGRARRCRLVPADPALPLATLRSATITLDGAPIAYNTPDGWDAVPDCHGHPFCVELRGGACASYAAASAPAVTATPACGP